MPPRLMRRPEEIKTDVTAEDLPDDRMRAMLGYWDDTRRDAAMPPESAIDPLAMPKSALSFLSVIDVVGNPARLRIRLQGTQLVEVVGSDQTWQYLDEIKGMEQQVSRSWWCIANGKPYMVDSTVTWGSQNYRRYCSLNLPFGTAETGVSRIVSIFYFA